jgi:dienelactone hydrolase
MTAYSASGHVVTTLEGAAMHRQTTLLCLITCIWFAIPAVARAAIQLKEIEYKAGDQTMQGYLAWDDSTQDKRPGILVIHEFWGNNDYSKMRAQKLAELGYVGFAADMYGKGKVTDDAKQATGWMSEVRKNPDVATQRLEAALKVLKDQPQVDANKIGAIGYCFGGSTVLQAAIQNLDDIKAVASFHGGLGGLNPGSGPIKAKVLVCTGADDAMIPQSQVEKFEKQMKDAGADIKVISYPGAHHSFTNPDADKHHMNNIAYNKEADEKSWQEMKELFASVFK